MKKIMFAVVIAAIATSPAMAAKKKGKRMAAEAAPIASANPNENSWRFVKDAFPVFLPSWSIPLYLQAKAQ